MREPDHFTERDDFAWLDATALAALVRSGEVSAGEVMQAAIDRIERKNPPLNAVVANRFEAALETARNVKPGSDAPFAGVPFLIKDLSQPYPGMPATDGSRLFVDRLASTRTALVDRYEAAGLIVCGKTNAPEFGIVGVTEPLLHGPCRNPWDLARTPGGSSGGAGAAVAAGLVPIAHGGDGGGSIRIPASCCGVVGLKPSRGRNPPQAATAGGFKGLLTVEHVITRSVRDSALALDVSAQRPGWSLFDGPDPASSFRAAIDEPPPRLRVAALFGPLFNDHLHEDCRSAVVEAAALLGDLGHRVDEAFPAGIAPKPLADAFLDIWCAECAAGLDRAQQEAGRRATAADIEVVTWAMSLRGEALSGARVAAALACMQSARIAMEAFFEDWDAILMPTLAAPPIPIGADPATRIDAALVHVLRRWPLAPLLARLDSRLRAEAFRWVGYTPLANITGQPAIQLPLAWSTDGLPIGIQIVGRFGGDAMLLRLARQLEEARPWHARRPALAV